MYQLSEVRSHRHLQKTLRTPFWNLTSSYKIPRIKGQFCIFASAEGALEDALLGVLVGSGTISAEVNKSECKCPFSHPVPCRSLEDEPDSHISSQNKVKERRGGGGNQTQCFTAIIHGNPSSCKKRYLKCVSSHFLTKIETLAISCYERRVYTPTLFTLYCKSRQSVLQHSATSTKCKQWQALN